MKTSIKWLTGAAVIAVLTLGGLAVTRAQTGALAPGRERGALLKKLAALGVTDDQRTAIKAILQKHRPELAPLAKQFVTERRALRDAIQADPVDEKAIRAKVATVAQVGADLAVARARVGHEVRGVLTPGQLQKLHDLRAATDSRVDDLLDRVAKGPGEE